MAELNTARDTTDHDTVEIGILRLGDADQQQTDRSKATYTIVTRHCISYDEQSEKLCRRVTIDKCLPCLTCVAGGPDDDPRPTAWIWYFISSELLMFSLRIIAIVFGVVKEVVDLRHDETIEHMHFVVSVIETVITVGVIILHMLNTRLGYIKVRRAIHRLENVADIVRNARLRLINRWMWLLLAVGVAYLAGCIACFFMFHHLAHLGWTLLSNQVFIVTLTFLIGLYTGYIAATLVRIREDQHKVVIHEALLLLQEISHLTGETHSADVEQSGVTTTGGGSSPDSVRRFISAVYSAKLLAKPPYILVSDVIQQHQSQL